MSPAQQKQLDWVNEQMGLGNMVTEYSCPDCDEPNFGLKPDDTNFRPAKIQCPHCEKYHFRTAPGWGVFNARSIDN